jgi:phospholipase/carboxylesterase
VVLKSISLPLENSPKQLVVALHGWGANCYDLVPIASQLELSDTQFIFPEAPYPHPQVPEGKAWYDLETFDYEGLAESRTLLYDWLLALEKNTGISLNHTYLVGFSQGGAMSLDVGLDLPLQGICSLSGYLQRQPEKIDYQDCPILIIHGQQDPIVPIQQARNAQTLLTGLGAKVAYRELNMSHEISLEAIDLLREFIVSNSQTLSGLE